MVPVLIHREISFLFGIFGQSFTGIGTYAMAMAVAILERLCAVRCSRGRPGGRNAHCQSLRLSGEAFPLIATIGFLVDPAATFPMPAAIFIASGKA